MAGLRVVGVVRDVPPVNPDQPAEPEIYWSNRQQPRGYTYFIVRSSVPPATIAAVVRQRIRAIDRDLDPHSIRTMSEMMDRQLKTPRFQMLLLLTFGASALLLAAVPVLDEAGQLIRVVVNEKDLTEIDALHRQLEEQAAIRERFRDQMLEMQLEESETQRFIARSPCMQRALRQAIKVSAVESTVLLLGESGVGKGLVAELIHKHSSRARSPLIKINCGAIPESLIEAELFGYEKGAFTGAVTNKPGRFELARGGTIFLDEIGDVTPALQAKLLRVLQERTFERLGGTKTLTTDARIVSATNRDLEAMSKAGEFREDLYWRLNVVPVFLPALRERREDLPLLIEYFLERFAMANGREARFSAEAMRQRTTPGEIPPTRFLSTRNR